jgi:beta-fructofuranosidase
MIAVIDRSIFEVFIDGGAEVATVTFFPTQPLTSLAVSSANIPDGMTINVAVYAIESAWAQYENEQGTVVGNVTVGEGASGGNSTAPPAKRHMVYEAMV